LENKNQPMNIKKIIYWIATAIFCFIFLFSAYNYFTNYEAMAGYFDILNFPRWVVYPLAIAKILGVVAVLSRVSPFLKEWAYAGFFFDALLAFTAHNVAEDGGHMFAAIVLVTLVISRALEPHVFNDGVTPFLKK